MNEKQELFDKVWTHMKTQNALSKVEDGNNIGACMYLSENGNRCAIGCLIDDETAKKWDVYGDSAIQDIFEKHQDELPELFVRNIDFLIDLQVAHDNAIDVEYWEICMRDVADYNALTVNEG